MDTLLKNVTLIDGTGADAKPNIDVRVKKDVFDAIGHALDPPPNGTVIDASGTYMIPGLIDVHMHVTTMPAFLDAHGHMEQSMRAIQKLRHCLLAGTTTVANMGGCAENVILKKAIESNTITGCASLQVAMMVNATGGHVRGRSADGPWEIRKAVREMIMQGADMIKTAASGGFMWEDRDIRWEDYTVEELDALVKESHAKDRKVVVHAHTQPGLNNAIHTNCDVITHGALIDDEALEGIAKKNLFYIPTLYITSEASVNRQGIAAFMKERMKHAQPIHREGVVKARKMGITVGTGTDGGPKDLLIELRELADCGYTPAQIIVCATKNAADSMGLLHKVGTIEAGKYADYVLLNQDPLKDIRAIDPANIALIVRRGCVQWSSAAQNRFL